MTKYMVKRCGMDDDVHEKTRYDF